jgi:hypothetical protein
MRAAVPDRLDEMLTRLKLTGIRDQLDGLLDEAGRQELSLRETLVLMCEREIARNDCDPRSPPSPQLRDYDPRRQLPLEGKAPQRSSAETRCDRSNIAEKNMSAVPSTASRSLATALLMGALARGSLNFAKRRGSVPDVAEGSIPDVA